MRYIYIFENNFMEVSGDESLMSDPNFISIDNDEVDPIQCDFDRENQTLTWNKETRENVYDDEGNFVTEKVTVTPINIPYIQGGSE